MYQAHDQTTMGHQSVRLITMCFVVMGVSSFSSQGRRTWCSRPVPVSALSHAPRANRALVPVSRGLPAWNRARGVRRRCSGSPVMLGGHLRSVSDLSGFGASEVRHLGFNWHRSGFRNKRSRLWWQDVQGTSVTTPRVSNVGLENPPVELIERAPSQVGVSSTGNAVKERDGGNGPEGWQYWGYRALLLGVAVIWGTNFPTVR